MSHDLIPFHWEHCQGSYRGDAERRNRCYFLAIEQLINIKRLSFKIGREIKNTTHNGKEDSY